MESFYGYIESLYDAYVLIEACRQGVIQGVKSRFTDIAGTPAAYEGVKSGSVFVWSENKTGIKRWRDLKSWSASRHVGGFLMYKEKVKRNSNLSPHYQSLSSDSAPSLTPGHTPFRRHSQKEKGGMTTAISNEKQDTHSISSNTSLVPCGLVKKTFSVKTIYEEKFHLVSYYFLEEVLNHSLKTPSETSLGRNIKVPRGVYIPELDLNGTMDPLYITPLGNENRYDIHGEEVRGVTQTCHQGTTASMMGSPEDDFGMDAVTIKTGESVKKCSRSRKRRADAIVETVQGNMNHEETLRGMCEEGKSHHHSVEDILIWVPSSDHLESHSNKKVKIEGDELSSSCFSETSTLSVPRVIRTTTKSASVSSGDVSALPRAPPDFLVHNSWRPIIQDTTYPLRYTTLTDTAYMIIRHPPEQKKEA